MRSTVSSGDLALAAQPATRETFKPYGTVLTAGDRTFLGRRGRVLVTYDERQPGPRRVEDLVRYPTARRAVISVGPTPMWVAVLAGGDAPDAQPAAFLVPGGACLVIEAGVWHAGPVPLAEATMCEMFEAVGSADRFDRHSIRELLDAQALRVLLPEDPGAPGDTLDLAAPNAVLLDASLHGRIRLGCLVLDDLQPGDASELEVELAQTIEGLRAMWGRAEDLGELPGINVGRELYRDVGIAAGRQIPRPEALVAHVLAGGDVAAEGPLARALALLALRTRVPIAAYDGGSLGDQVLVRTGSPGEEYEGTGGTRVALEGRPVLCTAAGPFGSPIGDARASVAGTNARRTLVVLYLPSSVDDATAQAWLDGAARTLLDHAGGREAGRLIVG